MSRKKKEPVIVDLNDAEIIDMDEDQVRKIHDDYVRFIMPTRRSK